MKKLFIYPFISIFAVTLFSCSEDTNELIIVPDEGTTIDVIIGSEATDATTTKVSYTSNSDGSEFAFCWHSGDEISVSVPDATGNTNNKFCADASTNTSTLSGQLASWAGVYNLYAIFPYKSSGYSVTSGTIYHSLADQEIDASSSNSFDNGLMVAMAYDATAVSSDDYYKYITMHFIVVMH